MINTKHNSSLTSRVSMYGRYTVRWYLCSLFGKRFGVIFSFCQYLVILTAVYIRNIHLGSTSRTIENSDGIPKISPTKLIIIRRSSCSRSPCGIHYLLCFFFQTDFKRHTYILIGNDFTSMVENGNA